MRVLLVSTYEQGHQPLGLAMPAAALRARGHEVRCLDLAVETPAPDHFTEAEFIGISIPMHTAARLGLALAERVRSIAPATPLAFYGLYASLLHERLTAAGPADYVIGGEYLPALAALVDRLGVDRVAAGRDAEPPVGVGRAPRFDRGFAVAPDRSGLPPLERYARLRLGESQKLAGYVEATHGCAHLCRHCPIPPVYGGRLRLVATEAVLADIDALVAMGAQHLTFGDPDFLNAPPHSLAIIDALHARYPAVTFDVTAKVEHLLEYADLLPRLRAAGCLFLTAAFESLDDQVLAYLDKGHTARDLEAALDLTDRAGIALRPTWVPFTPWSTVESVAAIVEFVERRDLVAHVPPVQFALRLLVPPGSLLTPILQRQGLLGDFDPQALSYRWANPDPRVDVLQARVAEIAARAAGCTTHGEDAPAAFALIKQAVREAVGGVPVPIEPVPTPLKLVPGLTEDWFC